LPDESLNVTVSPASPLRSTPSALASVTVMSPTLPLFISFVSFEPPAPHADASANAATINANDMALLIAEESSVEFV
jgi:hypothetical protein